MSGSTVRAPLRWRALPFEALSVEELYRLLRLRAEVFVVEQACAFQDLDGLDPMALHVMGETTDAEGQSRLLAYARLLPAGAAFAEASIGRVVSSPSARGGGVGHALVREAIAELQRRWGLQPIRIGAQAHLQGFYGQSGFHPQGDLYLEDGIEHIEMVRA
ncbi:MAG: GNAT family N-acetyltransferase [Hydrogenophaga sp.]